MLHFARRVLIHKRFQNKIAHGTKVYLNGADVLKEGGGIRMSYANGIGSTPQSFNAIETATSSSTNRTAKAELSSATASEAVEAGSIAASPVDQASLSSSSGVMAQALSGSDVRTDKVAALQQSIAAGTYSVSASDVADKVINALLR